MDALRPHILVSGDDQLAKAHARPRHHADSDVQKVLPVIGHDILLAGGDLGIARVTPSGRCCIHALLDQRGACALPRAQIRGQGGGGVSGAMET